jgi:hypothetical protein
MAPKTKRGKAAKAAALKKKGVPAKVANKIAGKK